jgi:hypothetical protein
MQDVLSILVEMNAMEQDTLRILPLGLVARGINCNNELWMAAAMTHPDVMSLTPPQLAAFVGALQCTDLLKRPMSIWSSFQVGRGGLFGVAGVLMSCRSSAVVCRHGKCSSYLVGLGCQSGLVPPVGCI